MDTLTGQDDQINTKILLIRKNTPWRLLLWVLWIRKAGIIFFLIIFMLDEVILSIIGLPERQKKHCVD